MKVKVKRKAVVDLYCNVMYASVPCQIYTDIHAFGGNIDIFIVNLYLQSFELYALRDKKKDTRVLKYARYG